MEVTLRKAAALTMALQEAARKLPLTRQINVTIFATSSVADNVAAAQSVLATNVQKAQELYAASFGIRRLTSRVNAESGINALLVEKAALDATEKLLASLGINQQDEPDQQESAIKLAQNQLDMLKARATTSTENYGAREYVSVSVVSIDLQKSVRDQMNRIRLRKVALADELLTLNMTTKVSLPESTVLLLKEFSLV